MKEAISNTPFSPKNMQTRYLIIKNMHTPLIGWLKNVGFKWSQIHTRVEIQKVWYIIAKITVGYPSFKKSVNLEKNLGNYPT